MKIAVKVWFEFDQEDLNTELVEFDNPPHFMNWPYPILPRTGEYICQPAQFLSDREKDIFKKVTLKKFFKNFDEKISIFKGDDSLFNLYNYSGGDKFIVTDIQWVYDEKDGHYPIIHITELE